MDFWSNTEVHVSHHINPKPIDFRQSKIPVRSSSWSPHMFVTPSPLYEHIWISFAYWLRWPFISGTMSSALHLRIIIPSPFKSPSWCTALMMVHLIKLCQQKCKYYHPATSYSLWTIRYQLLLSIILNSLLFC